MALVVATAVIVKQLNVDGLFGGPEWLAETPLVADFDGDSVDDVIALAHDRDGRLRMIAIACGRGWNKLWTVELEPLASPRIWLEPNHAVVIVTGHAAIQAFDAKTGARRWAQTLPNSIIADVRFDGAQLWVDTNVSGSAGVRLLDGALIAGAGPDPREAPSLAAAGDRRVEDANLSVLFPTGEPPRLRRTGPTAWETELWGEPAAERSGLAVGEQTVFVIYDDVLHMVGLDGRNHVGLTAEW